MTETVTLSAPAWLVVLVSSISLVSSLTTWRLTYWTRRLEEAKRASEALDD